MSTSNLTFLNQFHDYGLPYKNPGSPSEFMINLQYLDQKIEATTREVTYWDLYKISTVLVDANAFYSSLNNLLPYSSMIINTLVTNTEDGDLNPGDIVIKNNNGSHDIIRAERGGIFYPSSIIASPSQNNYTYAINYSYSAIAPSETEAISKRKKNEDGSNVEPPTYICDYAKQMQYAGLVSGLVGSPYNKIYSASDIKNSGNKIYLDFPNDPNSDSGAKIDIEPIIKSFYQNPINGSIEEIYYDILIQKSSTNQQYTINFMDEDLFSILNRVVIK